MIFSNLDTVLNKTKINTYSHASYSTPYLLRTKQNGTITAPGTLTQQSYGMPITKLQTLNINYIHSQNSSGAEPKGSVSFKNYVVRLGL